MSATAGRAVVAEWTKIRSVRSTAWTLLLALVLSVGLGYALGRTFRDISGLSREQQEAFDPLYPTFYSLMLGQLALVAFAVLVVSSEYTSGTIRASLAAVPWRGRFYGAKVLAGTLVAAAAALVTVTATFYAAQAGLGPRAVSLGGDRVVFAAVGACFYLTLICVIAMGVAAMLRSSALSLAILLPLLFLGSQGLGNVPKVKTVTQYLPDQAGMVLMHLTGPADDPRFGPEYGQWGAVGILVLWTAAALVGGYLVLRRRDA
ncbi:ABC transporter permease subunit [Qaidamihabitans albus]|uniref:ABC transporter permease subunit n=1 Tax=Qaidamihabitans albus TaxID=2795733 RepID=UPI0018F27019|nr:ABC transporter permease subunit [Qaidamihabitans albus]